MRLFAPAFKSLLVMTFSTASTTPSLQRIPMDVPPFSTALTAYSTWKFRPSGEKTEFVRSYPVPIEVYKVVSYYGHEQTNEDSGAYHDVKIVRRSFGRFKLRELSWGCVEFGSSAITL